mmetsp:Transcript_13742/g.22980  ORF Transcript_13742/g.22980 Transcript_13742/m.22980 type:complete len:420 (-) Transcript_13742:560-1819(-)
MKYFGVLLLLFGGVFLKAYCQDVSGGPVPGAGVLPTGVQARVYATGLSRVREVRALSNGDLLVLEQAATDSLMGKITLLYDVGSKGFSASTERVTLAQLAGLNHALLYQAPYIYASSQRTLYRWRYNVGSRQRLNTSETVISNIPCCSAYHKARTIIFDLRGRLYVQVGASGNIDNSPTHSLIRRFDLTRSRLPISFPTGELFARGQRHTLGFDLDPSGNIWAVEMGMDGISRSGIRDFSQMNPADTFRKYDVNTTGLFYGYPRCYPSYKVPNVPRGQMVGVLPSDDAFCSSPAVQPVAYTLDPHSSPINIRFYPKSAESLRFGFHGYGGHALVTLHGSSLRTIPVGYRVVLIRFLNGVPVSSVPIFYWNNSTASITAPQGDRRQWYRRVTGLDIGRQGEVYVGLDTPGAGGVIVLRYP